MKTKLLIRMLFLIGATSLATSCKKDNFDGSKTPQENLAEISTVKKWYEEQPGTGTKSNPQHGTGTVEWDKMIALEGGNIFISPVKISSNLNVSKFLIASVYKGDISQAKFVYVISTDKKIAVQEAMQFAAGNAAPSGFSGAVLEYDLTNRLIHATHYGKGKVDNSKKDILSLKKDSSQPNQTNNTGRQCWAVFLNTYVDGILVNSILLYTYCDQETEPTDTIDPTGGGGSGGDNTITDSLQFNGQVFNDYTQQKSEPATILVTGEESMQGDPTTGTFQWVVTEGLIAHWKVIATTEYSYYKALYYNTNAMAYEYDLFSYHTVNSQFSGSNTAINSTWSQGSTQDYVTDNNSPNTKGHSTVTGNLRHKANFVVPMPWGPSILDITQNVSGSCTMLPR